MSFNLNALSDHLGTHTCQYSGILWTWHYVLPSDYQKHSCGHLGTNGGIWLCYHHTVSVFDVRHESPVHLFLKSSMHAVQKFVVSKIFKDILLLSGNDAFNWSKVTVKTCIMLWKILFETNAVLLSFLFIIKSQKYICIMIYTKIWINQTLFFNIW